MLLISAVSGGVGVHIEDVAGLPLRDAVAVAETFGQATELRAGVTARVDDPLYPRCARSGRCVGNVAARTDASHLVFLRLIGGVTKIRVVAVRLTADGTQVAEAVANLARAPESARSWRQRLDRLAGALFPEPLEPRTPAPPRLTAEPIPSESPSGFVQAAPWVVVGLGAASGVAGIAFGQSSASARDRIESQVLSGDEYTDALGQMRDHGTAANVLFGVAIGGVVTGVAWLLLR